MIINKHEVIGILVINSELRVVTKDGKVYTGKFLSAGIIEDINFEKLELKFVGEVDTSDILDDISNIDNDFKYSILKTLYNEPTKTLYFVNENGYFEACLFGSMRVIVVDRKEREIVDKFMERLKDFE